MAHLRWVQMLNQMKSPWVVAAIAISAVAYYAATFGIGTTIGSATRFKIILAMLFSQSVGLVILSVTAASLLAELRPYQRAASQLALLKGMWRSIDVANEAGGLSPDARNAIYKEADTVFNRYSEIMKNGDRGA